MTGPIHPDRYNELCQIERRMKFLVEWCQSGREIMFDDGTGAPPTFIVGTYASDIPEYIDVLMARHPELLEETTEAKAI